MVLFLIIPLYLTAQEVRGNKDKKESTLSSKAIDEKGQEFDKQILDSIKEFRKLLRMRM